MSINANKNLNVAVVLAEDRVELLGVLGGVPLHQETFGKSECMNLSAEKAYALVRGFFSDKIVDEADVESAENGDRGMAFQASLTFENDPVKGIEALKSYFGILDVAFPGQFKYLVTELSTVAV